MGISVVICTVISAVISRLNYHTIRLLLKAGETIKDKGNTKEFNFQ